MKIATGRVIDGKVVLDGEPLAEGSLVTVVAMDGGEGFDVAPEDERALLAAIAEADRGEKARTPSPTSVPTAKVRADNRKGGTSPDASVISASSAHMATARKPIKGAPCISLPAPLGRPRFGRRSFSYS